MSLVRRQRRAIVACGRVSQNRRHRLFQISARLCEDLGDTAYVCRVRITGHQVLDELLADKRGKIRVIENVVQRSREIQGR